MIFKDRSDAGGKLAEKLTEYANRQDVFVLALPRGGVPVAFEVAKNLNAPLDVFIVRKLGVPGHEELALGAIASGGVCILNKSVVDSLRIPRATINKIAALETIELERREREYRSSLSTPDVSGKIAILIDDGLATGATMWAAAIALRNLKPEKIVVAVPVASPETCEEFRNEVDEIICAATPQPFYDVGKWYEHFTQVTDKEVRDLLEMAEADLPENSEKLKYKPVINNWEGDIRDVRRISL